MLLAKSDHDGGTRPRIPDSDDLVDQLGDLGLSPYPAKVLVALVALGTGNTVELAEWSGVPRTSIYPVLNLLVERGLAERLSDRERSARWACRGWWPSREEEPGWTAERARWLAVLHALDVWSDRCRRRDQERVARLVEALR